MAKLDISKTFHQIPLHKKARKYFAYAFRGKVWVPRTTPMGAKPVPGLANTLTSEISAILWSLGIPNVIMTDDIFIVGKDYEECKRHLDEAIRVLTELGWILNLGKTEGPSDVITFLGIQIDSINKTLSIPESRVEAYSSKLSDLLKQDEVSAHDLESMAGKLQWITTVFPVGRAHLSAVYSFAHYLDKQNKRAKLTDKVSTHFNWWKEQLEILLRDPSITRWSRFWIKSIPTPVQIWSDASGEDETDHGGKHKKTGILSRCYYSNQI